jgi:hypothetical protein
MDAAAAITAEEDVQEIMVATYRSGESEWMDHDIIDRVRKATDLGVTRVVVRPDEAATPVQAGVPQLVVIANDALATEGLLDAVRSRADQAPTAVALLCPLSLDGPGWTDDAERARDEASTRVQRALGALVEDGIPARGEVVDGGPAEAARAAVADQSATEIALVAVRGRGGEDALDDVRAAAAPIPVELIQVDAETPAAPSGGQ